jgi:hypothetical protein
MLDSTLVGVTTWLPLDTEFWRLSSLPKTEIHRKQVSLISMSVHVKLPFSGSKSWGNEGQPS